MTTRIAVIILSLTAMFAATAMAADIVEFTDAGGALKAFSKAGKYDYSRTIISVEVPKTMGVVVYDKSGKALAAFSHQNSGLKTKIGNVAQIEIVNKFPSKEQLERFIKDSKWDGMLCHADGSAYLNDDPTSFSDGNVTMQDVVYPLDNGVRRAEGREDAPPEVSLTSKANGYETVFEWITPTVMRSDSWASGKRGGGPKNNPAQFLGVYQLKDLKALLPTAEPAQGTAVAVTAGLINPSFEEPVGRKSNFTFVKEMPGWKTTDEEFEIWSTGFKDFKAHDGNQFVELNAKIDGTLYQDSEGIAAGSVLEFTFAHRGRNGKDTMKLTITDLGKDNALGGGDDALLFAKEYSTGKEAWSTMDPENWTRK